jgi:hypothetical protein
MYKHKYLKYRGKYDALKKKVDSGKTSKSQYINIFTDGDYKVLDTENVERDPDFIETDELTVSDSITYPTYLEDKQDPDSVEIITSELPTTESDAEIVKVDTNEFVNIGAVDKLQVKREKAYNFSDENFIEMDDDVDKMKILHLKTLDNFDDFTELYGDVKENFVYIRWSEVASNYHGIFVEGGLSEDRREEAFFEQESYRSWWFNEYSINGDEVAVFIKQHIENVPKGKSISKPFRGTVFEEFQVLEDEFIDMTDSPNSDKVVVIHNHMDFDKFSNQYGYLKDDIKLTVDIVWTKVSADYMGFYIDKDYKIEGRDKMMYFQGSKYTSWLIYADIKQGLVYIFK